MRVFVTGGGGFVGSQLVPLILESGAELMVLAKPEDPLTRLVGYLNNLKILRANLEDREALQQALAAFRPELCLHLAWYAEPGKYLYSPLNVPTLYASIGLLEVLVEVGCQGVVMVGTCAEYDTNIGYLREDSATRPNTIYAATKLALANIGEQIAAAAQINFAWARLFYLYGPQEDERRMVPALIKALKTGQPFAATPGEQVRDYLHVHDVASALWHLAANRCQGVYNISSGDPITIRRLMETIGDILGQRSLIQFGAVPYRQWEPMFICGDNGRLRAVGWQPTYTLEAGLRQTIKSYENESS